MKSPLAKARDQWLLSEDGNECCEGQAAGKYLQNRLVRAFLAGAEFSADRNKELEAENWWLQEYKKYVMAEISRGSMPMGFQVWNQTVDKLEKDLKTVFSDKTKRQNLKEHGIEYSD